MENQIICQSCFYPNKNFISFECGHKVCHACFSLSIGLILFPNNIKEDNQISQIDIFNLNKFDLKVICFICNSIKNIHKTKYIDVFIDFNNLTTNMYFDKFRYGLKANEKILDKKFIFRRPVKIIN